MSGPSDRLNEKQLRRILREYICGYYNGVRAASVTTKECAAASGDRSRQRKAKIISLPQVGGLHHRYLRAA